MKKPHRNRTKKFWVTPYPPEKFGKGPPCGRKNKLFDFRAVSSQTYVIEVAEHENNVQIAQNLFGRFRLAP